MAIKLEGKAFMAWTIVEELFFCDFPYDIREYCGIHFGVEYLIHYTCTLIYCISGVKFQAEDRRYSVLKAAADLRSRNR